MEGKIYVWYVNNKYYYSTAPYRQYGVEISFEEFAAKKLEGAEDAQEINYSWQGTMPSWTTSAITWSSNTATLWTGYANTTNTI